MPTPPRPTRGQQRLLAFAGRANRRLRGQRTANGDAAYDIVELDANQSPRLVQTVAPVMVASLVDAGWLAVAAGDRATWWYRVTEAGVAAANLPAKGE